MAPIKLLRLMDLQKLSIRISRFCFFLCLTWPKKERELEWKENSISLTLNARNVINHFMVKHQNPFGHFKTVCASVRWDIQGRLCKKKNLHLNRAFILKFCSLLVQVSTSCAGYNWPRSTSGDVRHYVRHEESSCFLCTADFSNCNYQAGERNGAVSSRVAINVCVQEPKWSFGSFYSSEQWNVAIIILLFIETFQRN